MNPPSLADVADDLSGVSSSSSSSTPSSSSSSSCFIRPLMAAFCVWSLVGSKVVSAALSSARLPPLLPPPPSSLLGGVLPQSGDELLVSTKLSPVATHSLYFFFFNLVIEITKCYTITAASRVDFSPFELEILEQAHLATVTREHHRHRHSV